MKFVLDNFTPPSFIVANSALLLPTKCFRLAIGGTALKCTNDTKIFVQAVLQLANCS